MKWIIRCLLAAVLCGIHQSMLFLNSTLYYLSDTAKVLAFSDIILAFGLETPHISLYSLTRLMFHFFPLLFFQALFGTLLYRRFCVASVYYFSRCPHRGRWFRNEAAALYGLVLLYLIFMIGTGTAVTTFFCPVVFDEISFLLFAYYLLLYSLWLFATTLAINLLALRIRSGNSFALIGGFQAACIPALLFFDSLLESGDTSLLSRVLPLNPITHLIISWHSSAINLVNDTIAQFQIHTAFDRFMDIDFDLASSLLLLTIVCIAVIIVGFWTITRQELIGINTETGDN